MIKNIIFDWSGTLSNDFLPVFQATQLVFKMLGQEPITLEDYKREFKLPYMDFWHKYMPWLSQEKAKLLMRKALDQTEPPRVFPGVPEVLRRLDRWQISMFIISAHYQDKLEQEAIRYGLKNYFKAVVGDANNKAKAAQQIISHYRIESRHTLFIGDMIHDIESGKATGIKTAAIYAVNNYPYIYNSVDQLVQSLPDYILTDIHELAELVVYQKSNAR